MLDVNLLRKDPEYVRAALAKRQYTVDLSTFLQQDQDRRALLHEVEELKAERNRNSQEVPRRKKAGEPVDDLIQRGKEIGEQIKQLDEQVAALDKAQQDFLLALPNLPQEHVKAGGKEANELLHTWGEKPFFDFPILNHVELCEKHGLIDYPRGSKLSGNGYWLYRGFGSKLEWALLNYFIDTHLKDGYEFILPPHMLLYEDGLAAGQFPKFEEDVYQLKNTEDAGSEHAFRHFLLPTAETALVNLYRDEVLSEDELPQKLFAYTPCYRREAGSYRAEERGMIRGHQFNKVELFQYTTPEQSAAALQELIGKAEALVQGLELHYQLSALAAGDCSASMRETYDIEVWIPSMGIYKEVSSASNAGDYQARRGNIRYRRQADRKLDFVHTLNASGLATSRILPALVEQHQQADGSIYIPEALRPYLGGLTFLGR